MLCILSNNVYNILITIILFCNTTFVNLIKEDETLKTDEITNPGLYTIAFFK